MSRPQSKLSEFRSYSYYHVLALCKGTDSADALMDNTDLDAWQHPDVSTPPLGRFSPKTVKGNEDLKYVILVNGSTDATFVITTAKWNATTAGDATPQDRNTSVAVEGNMMISEPKGVVFMDQLVKCCNAMDLNIGNAVYVLKTFFVGFGYNEEEGDYAEHISDIPPIQITLTNVTGSFTEQGGVYDLQFVSLSGGAVRLPQYSRLPAAVNLAAAPTLGGTLRKLEARIQSMYQPYFNCVRAQLSAAVEAAGKDPIRSVAALRPVTYKISYDGEFENYTVTNQSQLSKTDPGCSSPVNIASSANMSIEDVIHSIMSASKEVTDMMAKGIGSPAVKYEYKIHAFLEMPDTGPVVTYHIGRFMRPADISKLTMETAAAFDKGTASDPLNSPTLRKNIIEFDYIYTGKNIDILEFEMKMAQGLAYLQIATATNTFKDQLDDVPGTQIVPMTQDQANMTATGKITPIPVFFGSKISLPKDRNSQNSINSAQAAYTMVKHSSIEIAGAASMRIIGNLNFLGGINRYTAPAFHVERIAERKANFARTGKSDPEEQNTPQGRELGDFGVTPSYAHINIKMPRSNDDIALFSGQSADGEASADYAVDFWFDGFYYIMGVENVFEQGEFTQILHMIGIPKADLTEDDPADNKPSQEVDLTQRVADCYSGKVGCGQSTPTGTGSNTTSAPAPKVENSKPVGSPTPTNTADAKSVNDNAKSPSDVKGWAKARPAIRDSITNAAAATGTSPTTLAQMAQIESGMGTATMNPTSSARGTFQIVKGTWENTVAGGVPGVPRGTPFANANDPDQNALVAATLMTNNQRSLMNLVGVKSPADVSAGDTYMAHFMGASGAKAVITADKASNGSTTVREAYKQYFGEARGNRLYNSQMKANASILKEDTTVGEMRARAEISMATSVPLASVKVAAGSKPPVNPKATVPVSESTTATRPATTAVAACKDCKAEDAKKDTQKSCDQAKPDTDKK